MIFFRSILIVLAFLSENTVASNQIPKPLFLELKKAANPEAIYPRFVGGRDGAYLRLDDRGWVSGSGRGIEEWIDYIPYNNLGYNISDLNNNSTLLTDGWYDRAKNLVIQNDYILKNINQCLFLQDYIPQICIDSHNTYVWGKGEGGSLGNGEKTAAIGKPKNIYESLNDRLVFIAAGQYALALVTASGKLLTWGNGYWGSGHTDFQLSPKIPEGAKNLKVSFAFFLCDHFVSDSLVVITQDGELLLGNPSANWTPLDFETLMGWFRKENWFSREKMGIDKVYDILHEYALTGEILIL